jgi:tetratricopeptide (TPR) repeat protein
MADPLATALEHHRRGALADAARIYETLLAAEPGHPDALHLLGVVALQQGRLGQAVELIGRAIGIRPDVAAYHANLGEAYRALGRVAEAADSCRTALRLQPNYAEAANSLGLALMAQGQLDAAIAQFRAALRLKPTFAMVHNNWANALRLKGERSQAVEQFRLAVRLDPSLAEPHSNLGQMLLEQGNLAGALEHCSRAVQLRPELPETHNNFGNALREAGRLAEAKTCYARALRLAPNLAMTHNNMAQALQEEGQVDEARAWYQKALALDPGAARFHCNLASLHDDQDETAAAVAEYETAIRLDPKYAEAYSGLGRLRQDQGRPEEAAACYRQALAVEPELAAAHCCLGSLQEELNEFAAAERSFRAAIRYNPRHTPAYAQLATLLRGKLPDADVDVLRRLTADAGLSDAKRAALLFGLASVLDARKEFVEAGAQLARANAMALADQQKRGQGYDPAAHTQFVSTMIATCTAEFFARVAGCGLPDELPVFIVGLPRSGTTLLEQILASHREVFGAGEQRLARDDFEALGREAALLGTAPTADDDPSFAALARLDRATASSLAQRHLGHLRSLSSTALRVVDKMPENYLYLGLLAALFPRAKFIHCCRDLRDVAVSCWITNFRHIRWANDPEHIASRFGEYQRLMSSWREVLPVPLLEVHYEDTVADLEAVARKLVSWCGLEWDPACLEFHRGKQQVRTASVVQVRQPIYSSSVARWKRYQPSLGSLLDRLGPAAEQVPDQASGQAGAAAAS